MVANLLSRAVIAVAVAVAAMALLVAAAAFLTGAFYLGLVSVPLAPWLAALIVGLALIGLAALVIIAARLAAGRWRRRSGELRSRTAHEAASAAEAHPYGTVSFAFLIGLALGSNRDLQEILANILRMSGRAR